MALGLFQWIGIGLFVALVLIPLVRWFWKRFDMPSKFAIETMRQQKKMMLKQGCGLPSKQKFRLKRKQNRFGD